jgi:hypothetical protein
LIKEKFQSSVAKPPAIKKTGPKHPVLKHLVLKRLETKKIPDLSGTGKQRVKIRPDPGPDLLNHPEKGFPARDDSLIFK